jgi:hypothetical protein
LASISPRTCACVIASKIPSRQSGEETRPIESKIEVIQQGNGRASSRTFAIRTMSTDVRVSLASIIKPVILTAMNVVGRKIRVAMVITRIVAESLTVAWVISHINSFCF